MHFIAVTQECNERKVNCGRVYSEYTLKPVLFGRNFKQALNLIILIINSNNSFLCTEYFIDFFEVKDGSHVRI